MRTQCKFYVSGLTLLPGKDAGISLALNAVSRGDRNAEWARATPVGTMNMTVNNPVAAKIWEEFMQTARATGKQPELFIDIYPSEDGWPGDGHAFRMSEIPEGVYGHGTCGECSMGKDDDVTQYDYETRKHNPIGKAHPNG